MSLTVELWHDDTDRSTDKLLPTGGFLNDVLPPPETPDYPILSAIDSYGATAFNYLQMDQFLREWDSLDLSGLTTEQLREAGRLREMAMRCKSERYLLWFEGD